MTAAVCLRSVNGQSQRGRIEETHSTILAFPQFPRARDVSLEGGNALRNRDDNFVPACPIAEEVEGLLDLLPRNIHDRDIELGSQFTDALHKRSQPAIALEDRLVQPAQHQYLRRKALQSPANQPLSFGRLVFPVDIANAPIDWRKWALKGDVCKAASVREESQYEIVALEPHALRLVCSPARPKALSSSLNLARVRAVRAVRFAAAREVGASDQSPPGGRVDPKPLDVNALVNGLSDMVHRTLGETISVETVLGAGLWRVEADPTELEAAIINLAVNARDAMANGGRLTIETSNAHIDEAYVASHTEVIPGQYVAIAVTDTGVGMDAKTAAQAFEPFFTTKAVGKGTGLGLSQVYGFVKQSGGHVKIYSELGHGTTVKLYLPRLASQVVGEDDLDSQPNPEAAKEETVLVLEDDDEVRAYSVESLRELGYRVIEAHDGPSALRLLERQSRVDLLFTDVVLPGGLTGAEVVARARTLRPALKVLFTTGYARNAIIHHGRLDKGVQLIVSRSASAISPLSYVTCSTVQIDRIAPIEDLITT